MKTEFKKSVASILASMPPSLVGLQVAREANSTGLKSSGSMVDHLPSFLCENRKGPDEYAEKYRNAALRRACG